jgi:ABC-type antimicrobial peptide transport system permease subunit
VRQFLTENVLLSIIGGLRGVALGYALMAGLKAAVPPFFPPRGSGDRPGCTSAVVRAGAFPVNRLDSLASLQRFKPQGPIWQAA